ncbi:TetR/AcrR family transcriptional regulator [Microbispora cellulosiformans]|uniref:TetR/AcrR family transcriptional regulator n=1 Tax=Microbispora cellulosiformans TaxID=2614688 RepID=A0A5J5K0J0_9ACTN|nr:TetR/AcrR family transcriptional regulator [Microbispora cellulosiformans]KAA9376413.1 TetR/AcrR family transcriptional regulator [Microbispora cellulosiformans]
MASDTGRSAGDGRTRRADASRNAALLLAAARELIAESDSEVVLDGVALDEVARRAGVGNATLYRHFPTRGDLLVALYADEVAALCRRGAELSETARPIDALFAWLEEFVVHVATKRALAFAATEGPTGRRTEQFDRWHTSIRSSAAELLAGARQAGAVRPDLTVTDLLALASGVALTATDVAHARRLAALLRRGVENDADGPERRHATPHDGSS